MAKICIFSTLLFSLLTFPVLRGQSTANTTLITTESTTTSVPEETYEYIIKLAFGLENEKIPEILIKCIYENSNNVTPSDIIALYKLNSVNLSTTVDALEELKYNPSNLLSITGLEQILNDFGIVFKDFYNNVFLNTLKVAGLQLKDFLKTLGINTGEFSEAISYGEGDPFAIFKKGDFSDSNLQKALEKINKTKDDLFNACRKEILIRASLNTTQEILTLFKKYNFDQNKALKLWDELELDIENAENITVFSQLLEDLIYTLDNITYIGILTNKTVAVNSVIYDNIKEKMKVSKLYAESLYDNTTVELIQVKSNYDNIITFNLTNDNFTRFIETATTSKGLENCKFVTVENDTIIVKDVNKVSYKKSHLEVSLDVLNITDLIQGSPLICNNKAYGLAEEIEDDTVFFDTFVLKSSGNSLETNLSCFVFISFLVYSIFNLY